MYSSINNKKNEVLFKLSIRIYPLDAIISTSYLFIDKAYIFLDCDDKDMVLVYFKGKKKLAKKTMENIIGEFYNELLNETLRVKISKKNHKIREYIIQQALYPSVVQNETSSTDLDKELDDILKEANDVDFLDDPLGIAVPWEEKYVRGAKKND